jgi:hypothetical protein
MIEPQDDAVVDHPSEPLSENHKSRSEMKVRTTLIDGHNSVTGSKIMLRESTDRAGTLDSQCSVVQFNPAAFAMVLPK